MIGIKSKWHGTRPDRVSLMFTMVHQSNHFNHLSSVTSKGADRFQVSNLIKGDQWALLSCSNIPSRIVSSWSTNWPFAKRLHFYTVKDDVKVNHHIAWVSIQKKIKVFVILFNHHHCFIKNKPLSHTIICENILALHVFTYCSSDIRLPLAPLHIF